MYRIIEDGKPFELSESANRSVLMVNVSMLNNFQLRDNFDFDFAAHRLQLNGRDYELEEVKDRA